MAKNVLTTSIVANRELEPGDNVEKLAHDIKESGLQYPLIVIERVQARPAGDALVYDLVDGLRRLEAIRSLGATSLVQVHVVQTWTELVGRLEQVHQHGVEAVPLTPKRVWQLKQFANLTRDAEKAALRAGGSRTRPTTGPLSDVNGHLARALKLGRSGGYVTHSNYLYNSLLPLASAERQRLAQEVIPQLEAGQMTLYAATDLVSGRRDAHLAGDIKSVADQRAAFTAALASMRGVQKGLGKVGRVNSGMSSAEFGEYVRQFTTLRNDLSVFLRRLRKEFEER